MEKIINKITCNMDEKIKEKTGITLIALVITIIILLILAGITISTLSDNGLFEKAKISKLRSDYAAARERVEIKLMEVQADCIGHGREYTIEEIAKNVKEDEKITIEKYYNESTSLIGTGVTENLVSLEGIVVSVDKYEEYKFLLGESCEIEGITMEEITDITTLEDFASPEEFEKEVLGKVPSNNNNNNGNENDDDNNDDDIVEEPEEEIKDVPAVGEDVDTTSPIEITTYMSIKSNTKNTLNLSGVENATYTVQEKTGNVSLSGNTLTANNNAGSTDSCKIQITGTYSGQSYTNNLTVYVEPKNLTTVEDEDGNTLEAFAIYEVEDLIRIRELVNSKANDTFNAKMMKDIDLSTVCGENIGTWIPIGYFTSDTEYTAFRGIFDGQNFTISNLYIYFTSDADITYCTSFIGNIERGVLKNLKFDNPYVYSEIYHAAVAVGDAIDGSIVENIKILNGEVNSTEQIVGGVCGAIEKWQGTEGSIIRNCYNNASINTDETKAGGICGVNNDSRIENCHNNASINAEKMHAGGISGYNNGGTIEKCYNTGPVNSSSCNAGGISGSNSGSVVDSCYNTGVITSTGKDSSSHANTGGIVGSNYSSSTVINCYNTGNVTASYPYVAGIAGYNGGSNGTQTVENVFNTGIIMKGTTEATSDIGKSSNFVGYLIGRYGSLTENYENTTKAAMALWNSDTILENLGENFKKNNNSKLNDGLPILSWQ